MEEPSNKRSSHLQELYKINSIVFHLIKELRQERDVSVCVDGRTFFGYNIVSEFYDAVEFIIKQADLQIHEANLLAINEHIKAKLLEQELKSTYNELFQRFPGHAAELISKSILPTRKELEQSVIIK